MLRYFDYSIKYNRIIITCGALWGKGRKATIPLQMNAQPSAFDIQVPDLEKLKISRCDSGCISINTDGTQCGAPKLSYSEYCAQHAKCFDSHSHYKFHCGIYDSVRMVNYLMNMVSEPEIINMTDVERVRNIYNRVLDEYNKLVKCYTSLRTHYADLKCVHIDCMDPPHVRRLVTVRDLLIHMAHLLEVLNRHHAAIQDDVSAQKHAASVEKEMPALIENIKMQIREVVADDEDIDALIAQYANENKKTMNSSDMTLIKMLCEYYTTHPTKGVPKNKCKEYFIELFHNNKEHLNYLHDFMMTETYRTNTGHRKVELLEPDFDMNRMTRVYLNMVDAGKRDAIDVLKSMLKSTGAMQNSPETAQIIAEFIVNVVLCNIEPPDAQGNFDLDAFNSKLDPIISILKYEKMSKHPYDSNDAKFVVRVLLNAIMAHLFMKKIKNNKPWNYKYKLIPRYASHIFILNKNHSRVIKRRIFSKKRPIIISKTIDLGEVTSLTAIASPNVWNYKLDLYDTITLLLYTDTLVEILNPKQFKNDSLTLKMSAADSKIPNLMMAAIESAPSDT